MYILDILQTSIKELQIEKNLKDIEQQWNNMRFRIQKHTRNTSNINAHQDRGFLISEVDEILQALEDSILLLNSIAKLQPIIIYIT